MHRNSPGPTEQAIGLGYLPDELLPTAVPLPVCCDDGGRPSSGTHRNPSQRKPRMSSEHEAIGLGYLPHELVPSPHACLSGLVTTAAETQVSGVLRAPETILVGDPAVVADALRETASAEKGTE